MGDQPDADDGREGEMEFQGRGRELGECQCGEIVENGDLADHEDLSDHEAAIDPDGREFQLPHKLPPVPALEPYDTQPRHNRILPLPVDRFARFNPTRIQRLPTIPPLALPQPNGRNCPSSTPLGNNSRSRAQGYITKCTPLPPMRMDPVVHGLARNKAKRSQYCVLCRILSKAPPGTPKYEAFTTAQNGPKGKIRRTLFVCDYCERSGLKVSLCKDFCFNFFHSESLH